MKTPELKVEGGHYVSAPHGNRIRSGCHHVRTAARACGGCYARVLDVLDRVNSGESGTELTAALFVELKAEGRAPRRKRARESQEKKP